MVSVSFGIGLKFRFRYRSLNQKDGFGRTLVRPEEIRQITAFSRNPIHTCVLFTAIHILEINFIVPLLK